MTLENLIYRYMEERNDKPENVNELLDFIRRAYVNGRISIVEYRNLYRELEERGAALPL